MNPQMLFVSFFYRGMERTVLVEGFGNAVRVEARPPKTEEEVEDLELFCSKHAKETLGLQTAFAKIISWQVVEGS